MKRVVDSDWQQECAIWADIAFILSQRNKKFPVLVIIAGLNTFVVTFGTTLRLQKIYFDSF